MEEPTSALAGRPLAVGKTAIEEVIDVDQELTRLIVAFAGASAVWLVFGTLVGLYIALKFVWPDLGVSSVLAFGRLRPVHTNVVFWGFASQSMIALALWVVPRTSQKSLHSTRLAWLAFACINTAVLVGVLFLLSGVSNGSQEYREFIWPVMGTFWVGLVLLAYDLLMTVAHRSTEEIYISNWYILAAFLWTAILVALAYLPGYQEGLGQTVMQGYYMHQGVGMWFTPLVLGTTYYFLPKFLNKPIYSYSLGVLAFWTQLVFYTLIGTHHFVFSPVPWSLQTVAIVFSVGMAVPVVAGTANFLLTMHGSWRTVAHSYTLPFILVGVIFYFVASMQGSAEALRSMNKIWHFTDFTVAHSHMTMFGFVTFLVWGGLYGLLPRLTGREPPHLAVGMHFWLALVGIVVYSVPLMIGGWLKGNAWIEGLPFMDSVTLMAPYWTGRAVGGLLMFAAHLVFGYNVWRMTMGEGREEMGSRGGEGEEAGAELSPGNGEPAEAPA